MTRKQRIMIMRVIVATFCWIESAKALVSRGNNREGRIKIKSRAELRPDAFGGTGVFAVADIEPGNVILELASTEIPLGTVDSSSLGPEVLQALLSSTTSHTATAIYSLSSALASWKLLNSSAVRLPPAATEILLSGCLSPALQNAAPNLPWSAIQWQIPMCWSDEILDSALIHAAEAVEEEESSNVLKSLLEGKRRTRILRHYATRLSDSFCTALSIAGDQEDSLNTHQLIRRICRQAVALVVSRLFTLKDNQTIALLPMIDCINHSSDNSNAKLVDTGDKISIVATTMIPQNAEVYISYGQQHAAESAFATYGFIIMPPEGDSTAQQQAFTLALKTGQETAKAELESLS